MGPTGLCRGAVLSTVQVCKWICIYFLFFTTDNINKNVWLFNFHSEVALKIWICNHCRCLMANIDFLKATVSNSINQHTFFTPLRCRVRHRSGPNRPWINSLPRRTIYLYLNIIDTKLSKSSLYLNSYWKALTSRFLFRNICSTSPFMQIRRFKLRDVVQAVIVFGNMA